MSLNRALLAAVVFSAVFQLSRFPARAADVDAGPLLDTFRLTLSPGVRTEAVSPFFYSEEKETQFTLAVPPLFCDVRDPVTDFHEFDLVYPFLTYDRFGTEYRWQLFQLLNFAGGQNQDEIPSRRFTVFPFYFQQRSPDPELNYTALLPIYGRLKNRLFRDEIFFVMFPMYAKTWKKGVATENIVYPFYHRRQGPGLEGWQFLPFYGEERKEITYRTNNWGDVVLVPGHRSRFVAWPFYLEAMAGIGTDNPQLHQSVLPAYSSMRSPLRDTTTVLWPFFSKIEDREKKYTEWQAPWPLVIFTRGEGKQTSRVWPIYSRAHTTNLTSIFYLWPVYKVNHAHIPPLDRKRTRILFFLYSDIVQKNTETGNYQRRVDFWPLYTHRRDYDGSTRLQVFSILEPVLPNNKSIERSYSPLWSVWRAERNAKTGASSESLLWNLYRRESTPESRKGSLLFGLFQYQSGAEGNRLRLFYIPLTKARPAKQ